MLLILFEVGIEVYSLGWVGPGSSQHYEQPQPYATQGSNPRLADRAPDQQTGSQAGLLLTRLSPASDRPQPPVQPVPSTPDTCLAAAAHEKGEKGEKADRRALRGTKSHRDKAVFGRPPREPPPEQRHVV